MAPSPVNITHVVIDGHGGIFAEVIEPLADALGRLGHTVGVTTNQLVADRLNVLVGHTVFLSPGDFALIQRSGAPYVVFQTEALDENIGFGPQQPAYVDFLAGAHQI
jgi:hypothetical protein